MSWPCQSFHAQFQYSFNGSFGRTVMVISGETPQTGKGMPEDVSWLKSKKAIIDFWTHLILYMLQPIQKLS